MKKINLTKKQLHQLKRLKFNDDIMPMESILYIFNKNELIKLYIDYTFGDIDSLEERKIRINNLIEFVNNENIPELLVPKKLVKIDKQFAGLLLPKINGQNASVYLKSSIIPLNIKIQILKQIGTILEKIKNTNPNYNAAFADVHDDNFMVSGLDIKNIDKSSVYTTAIDIDGMKLLDFDGNSNSYFYNNNNLKSLDKYETNPFGMILPSTNTDIFCFIMMILELISGDKEICFKSINEFKKYLDYLDKLGFNTKLLESFASIYKNDTPNITPLPYLDTISFLPEKTLKKL